MKKIQVIDGDKNVVRETLYFESEAEKAKYFAPSRQALKDQEAQEIAKIHYQFEQEARKLLAIEENCLVKGSEDVTLLEKWVREKGYVILQYPFFNRQP